MTTLSQSESGVQPYADEVFTGDGAAVSRLRLQVSRIAPHFRTALVTGERGVGKETVARELHRLSSSRPGPFLSLEIAQFADGDRPVELQGLLFLHGLDRLGPLLQDRLAQRLRLIQRETRIIFASECDLRGLLATGRLRQTLSTRVGALEIRVPALRDRLEDLESVVRSMLRRLTRPQGGDGGAAAWMSVEATETLRAHPWPGNFGELWQTLSELAASQGEHLRDETLRGENPRGENLHGENLRGEIQRGEKLHGEIQRSDLPELVMPAAKDPGGVKLEKVMQRHVFEVLQRCSGNKLRAAELLGISRSTLYRMLDSIEPAGDPLANSGSTSRRAPPGTEA